MFRDTKPTNCLGVVAVPPAGSGGAKGLRVGDAHLDWIHWHGRQSEVPAELGAGFGEACAVGGLANLDESLMHLGICRSAAFPQRGGVSKPRQWPCPGSAAAGQ